MVRPRPHERRARSGLALLVTALLACASAVFHPAGATAAAEPAATPAAATPPGGTLFDDFRYTGPGDPSLAAHGWTLRTGTYGPGPAPQTWSPDSVSFPADASAKGGRSMLLRATTDGTAAGTVQAQINTTQRKFYSGTYAARVHFSDAPATGADDDHAMQTFYAIAPEKPVSLYSELDFEYLPNGGWGASGPSLYTTAWNESSGEPTDAHRHTHRDTDAVGSLQGWHTLQMTVSHGTVSYYVDGRPYWSESQYLPREPMTINFNQWFEALASPGPARTWEQKVNWVYYNDSGALDPAAVDAAVDGYYASGTHFVDTVPEKTATPDHDGDGIGDISLFYDYGRTASSGCPQGSAEQHALFRLSGRQEGSKAFPDGIAPQWEGVCRALSPKFVTSGDYNGDGRTDIAALYDYGAGSSADPTCRGHNRVAIHTWLADPRGGDALTLSDEPVWTGDCWGAGTKFMDSGDFNGDGRSDIALLYDYTGGHVTLFTLSANASSPTGFDPGVVSRWNSTTWGSGTKFLTTGDFNGDARSDIGLLYDYTGGHVALFTLSANADSPTGFDPGVVSRWNSTTWGSGTKFVDSGDFNGDGRSDIALLYDYTGGHEGLFTLSASTESPTGFDSGVVSRWENTAWGSGTELLTTGDYNGDGKGDLALLRAYGTPDPGCAAGAAQAVFTLTAAPYGTGAMTVSEKPGWESGCWGDGTRFMN